MSHKYIVHTNNSLQPIEACKDVYIIETANSAENFNDILEQNTTKEAVSLRDLLDLWNKTHNTNW